MSSSEEILNAFERWLAMRECPECGTFHTTEESKTCRLYEEDAETESDIPESNV